MVLAAVIVLNKPASMQERSRHGRGELPNGDHLIECHRSPLCPQSRKCFLTELSLQFSYELFIYWAQDRRHSFIDGLPQCVRSSSQLCRPRQEALCSNCTR